MRTDGFFPGFLPQHGRAAGEARVGDRRGPSPTPEPLRRGARLVRVPAGWPRGRGAGGRRAAPDAPAARGGLQDQGCAQEALQGLLPGEAARALVRLLQDQPEAQAAADVAVVLEERGLTGSDLGSVPYHRK